MWPYHPELLAAPAPRYTSYPTAAEFGEITEADAAAALAAVAPDEAVSVYVHIPFCTEICWYCGCNTGAANRDARLLAYLDAVEEEIDRVASRLRGRVGRIAFGGGSPNAVPLPRFARLVERLVERFDAAGAILSVELDPRGLDRDWTDMLGALGIRRASLGVQTFAPHVQAGIGRIQPREMIEEAVAGLRLAGITSLNFDLMYGLPNQSLADVVETAGMAIAMAPERIALFGYAHLPQLLPRQRQIDGAALPDGELRFGQAWAGQEALIAAGYQAIGFDHFALPADPLAEAARTGRLRRNFQGFTDDPCDVLIGLGASAISSFPTLLAQNEKQAGAYRMLVSAGRLPVRRGIARSAEDRRRGAAIERLLCDGRVTLDDALRAEMNAPLAPFVDRGLAAWDGPTLGITADGFPYARAIARNLDAYRAQGVGAFSRAV
ncbi:radical SAM protein [Sphingomonas quercus]|uniref:Coproporphyrinogen-III oxidase n=1 Tax=Sphingomonas quercus TaxID=2842451 RepID=A0ABS6BGT0_9SPHN|nr:radical SAM protein [Sphingomonas quercus]MBU3076450.1 radical SAM protein [Sphingomonas quercus]